MCHHCVTEAVKRRMLSRRDLLKAAPVAALAPAALLAPTPVLAEGAKQVVDLSYAYGPEFPTYFGAPGISMEQKFKFDENGFNLFELQLNEHTGTHIDAPLHFSADGQSVDEIPVENLVVPLVCIDIRERADSDDEAQLTPDDITAWMSANGDLPANCCVAMLSGWGSHVGTDKFRNADGDGVMHYPGFHVEAAKMLVEESSAAGIASDTLSLDIGSSQTFDTHYAWLPTGRWGLENVANLETVPVNGATVVVGAPTHKGGSGGPARVLALV